MQNVSDEKVLQKIEKVLGRMDDDQDGSLKIEDVLKVILLSYAMHSFKMITQTHLNRSSKQSEKKMSSSILSK